MRKSLPKQFGSKLWRAIVEFDLIEPHDKILIGLSGGKDSIFLTYALSILQRHAPNPFSIAALHIDPMFKPDFDPVPMREFCHSLSVPFYVKQVNIAKAALENKHKSPCFTCAFFRRGAVNSFAQEHGFNKVALAHHQDDVVETFVMSLFYSGQLKTFQPKTFLDRTGLTIIRPLVYFREHELCEAKRLHGFDPIPSPCPMNGYTKRQEIKELIHTMSRDNKFIFSNLTAAMREGASTELWPPEMDEAEVFAKYRRFFGRD